MTRFLLASVSALLLFTGAQFQSVAAPDDGVSAPHVNPRRPIKTDPIKIGPVLDVAGPALAPNDVVGYDAGFTGSTTPGTTPSQTGGAILNFSVRNNSTTGAETILTSSTVGSGTAFGGGLQGGGSYVSVSPNGFIYYTAVRRVNNTNVQDIVKLDPVTLVRTVVSDGSDSNLGPIPYAIANQTWDFSTGTIIYFDSSPNFQGPLAGFYRMDPATGRRSAVSLNGGSPGSGVTFIAPTYPVVDTFGNIFYLEDESNTVFHYRVVAEIPVTAAGSATYGARKIISSNTVGSQTGGAYQDLIGLALDISVATTVSGGLPVAESLIVVDQGTTQANAAIYRLPTDTAAKGKLISFNSTNANTGTAVFDLPSTAAVDTTGRIYYGEFHPGLDYLTVIPAGTHAAAYLTSAENLSNNPFIFVTVPAPTPTLGAGSVTNLTGSTVTLNSSVNADGGVANTGTISRGFVYALTATTSTPRIGVAGVLQATNFFAPALPVAQGANAGAFSSNVSSLSPGASYTFSAYALDASGYTYTAPVTFVTPTAPVVTSPTATAITGVSATLGGNVTSDGGATLSARGVVYSTTSSPAPALGGSGVTTLTDASTTTGVFADGTGNVLANGTTYYFRAYATNAAGTSYSAQSSFTTFAPPTANSQSVTTTFNTAKAITLTGSDPNTPAQTLTYTVATSPTHGTLSGTAPNLTYTPTANYQGADSFTFKVTNTGNLSSNTATVSITVSPGTPTANAQSVSVTFNTAKAITLTGTDPGVPSLALTYAIATNPSHGVLSGFNASTGAVTYTPTANYQGADSFTFTVNNGTNTSTAVTVSLTVAAGTPTANSQSVTTTFNTAKAITLTGTDPDSPALSLTYTVATSPTHGTLSGTAPNLTYTPTANYQGADSFTFTVSNGQKTSAAATVSITVSPGTPTAGAQSVPVNFNLPKAITLTGTDPDSPALSLTYAVATNPANGALSGFNASTGAVTYTPNAGYAGADSFTFTVSNGTNTSAAATVSLTVIGQPTISSFTPTSGPVGTPVTITGTNLQNATAVNFFRNMAGTNFAVSSSTQVTVQVPTGATTGTLTVFSGSGSNSSSTKFTVTP